MVRGSFGDDTEPLLVDRDDNEIEYLEEISVKSKNMMTKLGLMFKSRTFWTLVVMFLVNGIAGIHNMIPATWLPFVDGILGILVIYFKLNPSQSYNQ